MSNSAVYWIGADGNGYVKGASGVQNYGKVSGSNANGFDAAHGSVQAKQIADPNPPSTVVSSGGAGAGDVSSYDQSIEGTNAQINNLTPTLNNLLQGAYNSYQQTINNLDQSKASADQTYGLNKTSNAQDYNGAKNSIRTNTGNTIRGIDTMLGSRGGGGQAAGDYAALLAGKAGTGQLNDAGTNFGKNEQGLDTNYNNFLNGYNTNVNSAGLQRDSDINSAQATIKTQKANLLQQLAGLINERTSVAGGSGVAASQPYAEQAKGLLTEAAAIGAPRVVPQQTPLTYTAPSLASYTTNPTAVAFGGGGTGATDTTTPFYTTLLNRNKQLQAA